MKKIPKATIAAGAGLALLLGTGSTLAFWNSKASLAGQQITAGLLDLKPKGTPSWEVENSTGTRTAVNVDQLRMVPGDVLIYTGTFSVDAQGQNLDLTASIAAGSIVPADAANTADVALSNRLAQSATYAINGAPATAGQAVTIKHRSNDESSYEVKIEVRMSWPFGAPVPTGATPVDSSVADNPAMAGKVSLSEFAVTATQVARQD